jgi:hypothetical protein
MFAMSFSKSVRLRVFAAAACGGFAVIAGAATTPKPPASICIGSNCATAPGVGGEIKWHPGHYVWISGPGYSAKVQSATAGVLAQTAKDSNLAGIQIIFKWAELEGATAGDYSAGFAMVDGLLAQLAKQPVPKRLMMSVMERSFGTPSGTPPTGLLPQYVINMGSNGYVVAPKGSTWSGGLNAIARLDNSAVMDRLIALAQAYGKRYNNNALVEMYSPMDESAVGGSANLNWTNYVTQMKRLYTATSAAWPNTLIRWRLNFAPADSADQVMLGLLATAKSLPNSAIGGPDPEVPAPLPSTYPVGVRVIQANMVFRGLQANSKLIVPKYTDLRGNTPWVGEYQGGASIGAGSVLPDDFGNYEINTMHASHIVYIYNTWMPSSSSDPHRWAAQLAYIDSTRGETYTGAKAP